MSRIINTYNDPLITNWELDDKGNKKSIEVLNEQVTVVEGKAVLYGLPDYNYRVYIDDMVEIDINQPIKKPNQFKVDYRHTGVIFFHPDMEGKKVTVNRYYSKGVIYYPASRVWVRLNEYGEVSETLDILESRVTEVVSIYERLDETIQKGCDTDTQLNTTIDKGKQIDTKIHQSVDKAKEEDKILNDTIEDALNQQDNLSATISDSITHNKTLLDTIVDSELAKVDLDNSIQEGYDINDILFSTINIANDTDDKLNDTIDRANKQENTLKSQTEHSQGVEKSLQDTTNKANASNDTLKDTIVKADKKDGELNTTIDVADNLEDELKAIIAGSNLEEIIQQIVELQNDKANKDDIPLNVSDLVNDVKYITQDDIEDYLHLAKDIKEDTVVADFQNGITISAVLNTSYFPSIGEFGVVVTFINKVYGGYAQLFITSNGDMWSRVAINSSSWGIWYSVKKEIDNKANKSYIDDNFLRKGLTCGDLIAN